MKATFLLSSRTSRWQQQEPWIALVAQGIERLPPEQKVVGSNPIEGTEKTPAAWKSGGGFAFPPPIPGANVHLRPLGFSFMEPQALRGSLGPGDSRCNRRRSSA